MNGGSEMRLRRKQIMIAGLTLILCVTTLALARQESLSLKIEDVMSAQELEESGVSGLSVAQHQALNTWLNHYTETVLKVAATQNPKPEPTRPTNVRSDCAPAVESTISGDFNGWEGDTIFKLDNGQIWEQDEYDYMYSYSYRPDITIYQTTAGCRMKVEDEDETIIVKRIK